MKVLIIDDDELHRLLFSAWLHDDFLVITAGTANEGYRKMVEESPDCIVLDYHLPGEDGYQFLHSLDKDPAKVPPIIFVSGGMSDSLKRNASQFCHAACFDKADLTREKLISEIYSTLKKAA